MNIKKRKILMAPFMAAAIVIVLVTQIGASDHGQEAVKLEGAWVARVTSMNGQSGQYPFQWSYVLAPAPSGRSASIHGSVDVAFPQDPRLPHDFATPIIGEAVQTGPNTAAFNSYWYAIKKASSPPYIDQIVFIGRAWGQARFLGPDKAEHTDNFGIYLPTADTNNDGLPEHPPILTFTTTTLDTRIPSPVQ